MNYRLSALIVAAFVFSASQPVVAQPMYGGTSSGDPEGAVGIVDQTNGVFTLIGDPTPGDDVLAGIDFNSLGQLFGVDNPRGTTPPSVLIAINPQTGTVLATIGTVTDSMTTKGVRIVDLAFQPITDVLFGISQGGILYRISTGTAVATEVGAPGLGRGGLAFAPDGTLYLATLNNQLARLDPTTGAALKTIPTSGPCIDGLAVRPSDGTLFGTACESNQVETIDPITGNKTLVGPIDVDAPDTADLAFFRAPARAPAPALSAWVLVSLAGMLLGAGILLKRTRVHR